MNLINEAYSAANSINHNSFNKQHGIIKNCGPEHGFQTNVVLVERQLFNR